MNKYKFFFKTNLIYLFTFVIFIMLFLSDFSAFAQGGKKSAEEICPLPNKYRVEMDNKTQENSKVDTSKGMGKTLSEKTITEDGKKNIAKAKATFVINEDEPHNWAFKTTPGDLMPEQISGCDSTTGNDYISWMPKLEEFHPTILDKSKTGNIMEPLVTCYTFKGIKPEGVKWDSNAGWKVNKVHHAYHMDSPNEYGDIGKMGYNIKPGESTADGGASGLGVFSFVYAEPSVPLWFVASSLISITWDWPYKYSHCWDVHHIDLTRPEYPYEPPDGKCDICGTEVSQEPNGDYWTDYKSCVGGDPTDWPPSKFYSGKGKIQKPQVADARKGSAEYFDGNGVGGKIYSEPEANFGLPNEPIVVARATVRVKDVSNVTHVQIGVKDENTNLLQAECGKKISEVSDKVMVIRIVDNAIHANQDKVVSNSEKNCSDGEWDDGNFKVNFWYEVPLYQYASYLADKWKDPSGLESPIIEMAYSPMFVWKKKTICTSLSDFFANSDGASSSKSTNYRSDKEVVFNPSYIVYEKEIKVAELFKCDDDKKEDIIPWHYARTSLGDTLGNPPYDKALAGGTTSDLKDCNGNAVLSKFKKYKPINFSKGKGPLKYFLEVKDGSASNLTKGGSRKTEEEKFDCSEQYVKADDYTQGQLKFNPEAVKYLVYSKSALEISQGASVNPTEGTDYCLTEIYPEYERWGDSKECWMENPVLKQPLNKNVGPESEILEKFQAFGRIEIVDKIKPNVGLKILDSTRGVARKVYKINDLSTLPCYKALTEKENNEWALIDNGIKHNYFLVENKKGKRAPFSLNADEELLWEFSDVSLLTNNSPNNGQIYIGRDHLPFPMPSNAKTYYPGTLPDATDDSLDPYGNAEDTKLEINHQDMRNDSKNCSLAFFYAHDNIDGQRVVKDGVSEVSKADWYKGLAAIDFETGDDKSSTFVDNITGKGYTSWIITDKTYPSDDVFKQMYMNGNFYKYPDITFNNPNCKWDGSDLANGKKEISVAYAVRDKEGNKRKFKLHFYIAPLDMKMQTIEKNERRTE